MAGTQVSATLPVSDRLLTRAILQRLPSTAPIRSFELRAHPGNRLTARVRLARPAFLPPFTFPITIVRQPEFPHSPVLVLRLGSPGGLLKLAGPLMRIFDVLPPGVALREDHVFVNLKTLLTEQGAAFALDFLESVEVATVEGQVTVSVRASVRGAAAAEP